MSERKPNPHKGKVKPNSKFCVGSRKYTARCEVLAKIGQRIREGKPFGDLQVGV